MKNIIYVSFLAILFFNVHQSKAQTANSRGIIEAPEEIITIQGAESTDYSKKAYKQSFRYKYYKHHAELVEDYYKRKEQVKKDRIKMERKMRQPKYSDPSYFGHKRKPKKHAAGKIKPCEECGISH